MGGRVWFHPAGNPDNGANRTVYSSGRPFIQVDTVAGRPGDNIGFNAFSVNGGSYDEWWWSGSTVRITGPGYVAMRGGNPGTANNMPARGYFGSGNLASTWTGGMGGYLDWYYVAPTAPYFTAVNRSGDGTTLYVAVAGGSNRVTYHQVIIDGAGWSGNGTTFGTGAHASYNVYGRAGNEDGVSGNAYWGVSYGIPNNVNNYSVSRSDSVAGRIRGSWTAPTYAGSSLNKYVVNRYDTVTGVTTNVVNSNTTSFNDDSLVRGRYYNYSIYAVGNDSPGNGLVSTISNIMAPGIPSAPAVPTIKNRVARTITINSTRGSMDFGNAISEYRVQLSTDGGSTWKGWNNTTKAFTADNTYNVLNSSGDFEYQLLTPALTYLWRVYAVNSIGDGETAEIAAEVFVGAGGKRYTGTVWEPTSTSRRYDGTSWVDFGTAKRWDGSAWVDLT